MHADWLKIVFPELYRNTNLTQAVDVMMARGKGIYILIIKVNKFVFLFFVAVFSKRNGKHVLCVSIKL